MFLDRNKTFCRKKFHSNNSFSFLLRCYVCFQSCRFIVRSKKLILEPSISMVNFILGYKEFMKFRNPPNWAVDPFHRHKIFHDLLNFRVGHAQFPFNSYFMLLFFFHVCTVYITSTFCVYFSFHFHPEEGCSPFETFDDL